MGASCSNTDNENVNDKINRETHYKRHQKSLSNNEMMRIFEQINKSICKIIDNQGSGFICKIPYPNNLNLLPVLITCNHVLGDKDLEPSKKIKLVFEEEEKFIEIDDNRKVYKSNEYDTTIIEIKKTDGFNLKNFLEVDEDIFSDNLNEIYKNKNIYVIHYPKVKGAEYSVESIKNISDNKIYHFCSTDRGSSGCPILCLDTFKVIGIHSGSENNEYNYGNIIKYPIEGFIKEFPPKEKKNEILLKLFVWDDNVYNKIYFLDNGSFMEEENKEPHNNLTELNENNTKIYIDNIEHKYCKFFIPDKKGIHEIKIEINTTLTNCSHMFSCCNNIVAFDFSSFNTSSVTNMSYMFTSCQNLRYLDLSSFDTSNVTNMSNMFSYCMSLMEINLSSFLTHNVIDMSAMFMWCQNLMEINVNNFNIFKVKYLNDMFNSCGRLTYIDLSSFIAKNAINVSRMFFGCESLKSIKFVYFDGGNITNMEDMFMKCSSLLELDLESFNTINVISMQNMFYGCQNLTNINFTNFYTKNVINMHGMFFCCLSLKILNLQSFDTRKVKDMSSMFSNCQSLEKLLILYFDLTNTENISGMFKNCMNLDTLVAPKEIHEKLEYELNNRYVEPKVLDDGIILI